MKLPSILFLTATLLVTALLPSAVWAIKFSPPESLILQGLVSCQERLKGRIAPARGLMRRKLLTLEIGFDTV